MATLFDARVRTNGAAATRSRERRGRILVAVRPRARWLLTDGLPILLGLAAIPAAIVVAVAVFHAPQRIVHWWSCNSGAAGTPTWSPDGREIAFAATGRCDVQLVVVRPDGSHRRVLTRAFAEWPEWSASGRFVLVETRDGIALIGRDGGRPRIVHRGASDQGASLSPDGAEIAFTHGFLPSMGGDYQSTMYVASRSGGEARKILGHSCNPGTPAWSPDGSSLAVGCADGLYVVNPKTGISRRVVKISFGWEPPKPAWSPDGTKLAFVDADAGGLYVVPTAGSRQAERIASLDSHGWSDAASWSPDGQWIVYSAWADGAKTDGVYIVRMDGRDARRIARL